MSLVVDVKVGCYSKSTGWDKEVRTPVEPVGNSFATVLVGVEEAYDDDPLSVALRRYGGRWYGLADHLDDVEKDVLNLASAFNFSNQDLSAEHLASAALAGKLHDIGKAHSVFQSTMLATACDVCEGPDREGPWAKSGGSIQARHSRKGFRHELASALALLDAGGDALGGSTEADLVCYLVAAHHGRIRLGIRSLPDEDPPTGVVSALGIYDGEQLPAVALPGGITVPLSTLRLSPMMLGGDGGEETSWTAKALRLRDREDLGPFRLAFLEALVRLADWRASARATGAVD